VLITSLRAAFAGRDASRALGKMSFKAEDCVGGWEDLDADEMKVLNDWYTFFQKRYNIVGKVVEKEIPSL
jgi:hypothetical protein